MASTSSSVTASPSTQGWTYDVFLSFRGPDVRKTFIDFLFESLERKGIRTFKDDDRLEKGDCISQSLPNAIRESKFFIAVFSKGYASSKWCLEELATVMECQEKLEDQIVVPIFYHVEPTDVRNQKGSFEDSFKELHEKIGKDDEKVRRWKEALKKAGELKGHHLQNDYNGYEATCAEKVAADIQTRLNQASLAFEENLVGLESRVNNIGNWLMLASDDDVRFIGICGMGGIGKTTTATAIFNRFSLQFDGACFLADVRQHNVIELQKTLLTKILKEKSRVEISNVEDGMGKIRRRLQGKKVLIVLDDVDDQLEQLEKLAGGGDWFGRGSRVIITTRDAGVLRSHRVDEKYIYQVDTLEEQEAIQLFSWYAFKKKIPETGFEALCWSIVHYAMGFPLCLKVLGSHLCGKNAVNWETILEKLEDANSLHKPKDKILEVLRISCDGLDPENKNVFLDIACFFRNKDEEYVKGVLDSDLCELIEKSLISVQNERIKMHDRIQEMGWYIASHEKPRRRLWQLKDVDDLLSRKMDHEHIEGISWDLECSDWGDRTVEITLREMGNLKTLIVVGGFRCHFHVMDLPSSLRWLEIDFYHFTSLPESFASSKLVCLSLVFSSLQNCRITQKLDKLTLLDLSHSESLLETPDFDWMPNLRRLNLQYCRNLKVVHPSIGNLRKLVLLDLSNCSNLEELPSFNQVSSLESLNLNYCTNLKIFPEIKARTPQLVKLDLREVGIIELPSSIQRLHGLTKLLLNDCKHLACISNGLCELKNLKVLEITNCVLKSLPENLEGLISLKYLSFQGSQFDSLPVSFSQLTSLQYLVINLDQLPELPANIGELYVDCGYSQIDMLALLAIECSEVHSVSSTNAYINFSLNMFIHHFSLRRETPLWFTYPVNNNAIGTMFKYRHYKSNRISIHFTSPWYSQNFVGFLVCFYNLDWTVWERHSFHDIGYDKKHCKIMVKLSHRDGGNKVLQKDCVIAGREYNDRGPLCVGFIPFRSLWGESKAIMDYSIFEVQFMNLKASANWGCNLLYKRQPGAIEDRVNNYGSDSGLTADDIACLTLSELEATKYLNLNRLRIADNLPIGYSQLRNLQYLDISGCAGLKVLPELPATIRELYAHSNLASERNIAELARKYSELYSVSFSYYHDVTLSAKTLARMFVFDESFRIRNSHILITRSIYYLDWMDFDIKRWFKYPSHDSNKVSIKLEPSWCSPTFVGFVVCFRLDSLYDIWESSPEDRPFRHAKVIAKLIHKDNANEVLQTDCVIGRLCEEEFYCPELEGFKIICFAYIMPFGSSLSVNPNDYSVFEVAFLNSNTSSDWSCGLLYKNDESLSEAIWSGASSNDGDSGVGEEEEEKMEEEDEMVEEDEVGDKMEEDDDAMVKDNNSGQGVAVAMSEHNDSGPNRTILWEIVDRVQCRMVSMPECSDAKVDRLLYTNSGVSILALNSDGIQKLWKWPNNEQNPTGKATAKSIPQHWQPNSGLLMINDVVGVNLEKIVPCIALSNDDSYIVSSIGGKISLFNIMTFEVTETIMSLPSTSTFLAFDPHDNNIIAIGTEKSTIYIYDRIAKDWIELKEHQKPITGLAFSTNLKLLVSSDADAQLCSWNTNIWKKRRSVRIQLPAGEVCSGDTHVMFHVDQFHLLVTHETQLAIYDASKMELINQWIPHGYFSAPISSATYSCNCQLIYASFKDGNIGVFDAHRLIPGCRIAPSAYLSQAVLNRNEGVYAVVIAAHPQEPNQLAFGLTDGSVKVIEPLESGGEGGISLTLGLGIKNLNGAEKKTSKRPAAMNIDELEARLKEKHPTATATSGAKKMRLQKGSIVGIRSPKSPSTVGLLSADLLVSKALEKAAAASSEKMDFLPAAPHRKSQINIVDLNEAVGLENIVELGAEAALAGPSQQLPEPIPSTDLVLAISPGNLNLQTQRPSKERGIDNNDPFRLAAGLEKNSNLSVLDSCVGEDAADEFLIKSLRSALVTTEKLLDKKRHLYNELSEERSRVTELEDKNRQLEALVVQLQNQQPTIDHLEKEKHELTLLVQTSQARAIQAEAANSNLLLAQKYLLDRYGTLEKQQLEDKQQYKKLEKEQLEVKDQCEGLKRSWNDAILKNEILKKKLLQAEQSGVSNWQQSPNFLNEVITRAMGQPEQRRKFFQVLEANPIGKEKLFDDNTNACLHGMKKMQQAIYNQLQEIAPDDFDVQKWGLPNELPDTESQNEAEQGPGS